MVPTDGGAENQNVLLVIATLIAAVTFQAGVNPPGGVWQESEEGNYAGKAIYASQPGAFYVFLISNTIALRTSILLQSLPLLHMTVKFRYVLTVAALPFIVRGLIYLYKKR